MANEFSNFNGYKVKDAAARTSLVELQTQFATLNASMAALAARVADLESGSGGGGESTGFSVDFTNTDTRERWSSPDANAPNIYGDVYFKINGVEYDGQNVVNLILYSNVSSFAVKGTGGMTPQGIGYTLNGESKYLSFNGEETWQEIPVTGNIVVTSFDYAACLTGDMMITMADGTEKRLDTLEKGDSVLAVDPATNELVSAKLLYCNRFAYPHFVPQYDVWTFEDGSIVKTAKPHRLYNVDRQAMVYMDEWQIGERAYNKNGEYVALVSHETIVEEVQHFTLFTEHQNYFVNGILAGNRLTPEILL